MGAVFISYRRGDTEGQARALSNELEEIIGRDSVFMDVDSIGLGRDFREVLEERLQSCDQMLVLIGPEWLDAKDAAGSRRLDQMSDFVRQEIATALKRKVPVTPVLVQGAQMPAAEQLPEDLKDLAFRNGFELSHTRWESDFHELVRRLGLRTAGVRTNSPGAGAVASPEAGSAGLTATGAGRSEQPGEAIGERLGPVAAAGRALRQMRWWKKLALFGLLAVVVLALIPTEEQPHDETSAGEQQPTGDAPVPNAPQGGATNPAPSPQAGPEAAKAVAAAQTMAGLIGEGKFNSLWEAYVSDWYKQRNDKEKTLATWSSVRTSLGSLNASKIIDVTYSRKDPQSGYVGEIYTVRLRHDYDARSLYLTLVLNKVADGQFRLSGLWSAPVPQD
jgi:hypothetical protein